MASNKEFGRWGEVLCDVDVVAATIDPFVHHADVIALKGDSCRLKDQDIGTGHQPNRGPAMTASRGSRPTVAKAAVFSCR